jgi:hypothetical protein
VDDVLEKRVFMFEISSAQGRPAAPILSGNWLLCIIFLSQRLFNLGDSGVERNDVCSGLPALSVGHAPDAAYKYASEGIGVGGRGQRCIHYCTHYSLDQTSKLDGRWTRLGCLCSY